MTLPRDAPVAVGAAPVSVSDLAQRLATVVGRPGPEIDCVYLFGSTARGERGPLSDIDVGILFSGLTPAARRLDLAASVGEDVERLTKSTVDVVILNDAPPAVRHRIVRDGLLLFAIDERRRVDFESRSIDEFLDFQPVLVRYDQQLLERAREGRIGT